MDQFLIEKIIDLSDSKIDFILQELGMNVEDLGGWGEEIRGCCPVHEGDNPTAFCYNQRFKGWACYTRKCHEQCSNIIGLTQRILEKQSDVDISFDYAAKWLMGKLGIDGTVTEDEIEILSQKKKPHYVGIGNKENFKPIPVQYLKEVEPPEMFLKDGFSPEVLKKYRVGFCDNSRKPMYLRAYAPVLDESGKFVIGVTGRTIYDKCQYCGHYHKQGQGCPVDNPKIRKVSKWMHHGFRKSEIFYNAWESAIPIKRDKWCILTEGPKEVWFFEQNGIKHSLSILGSSLSREQIKKLLLWGVGTVVVCLDKDLAGIEATEKITRQIWNDFRVYNTLELMGKNGMDIDEIHCDKVKGFLDGKRLSWAN